MKSIARLPIQALVAAALALVSSVGCSQASQQQYRTFPTAEDAVKVLIDTVKKSNLDELVAIFAPEGQDLVSSSDPATGKRNREVFLAAVTETWKLEDQGAEHKVLVIGNEAWPFPVPLVHESNGWRWDVASGKEEVIARRIGRNELAVISICHNYVTAQRRYAQLAHDGKPAGLFAKSFQSDAGRQNGLYWVAERGKPRSPLGDLVAQAAAEGRTMGSPDGQPTPFYGYYFKVLTAQGANTSGGARQYVVDGEMSGGFALVAWPAEYDGSGIMTFVINQDGVVHEKDLGPQTNAAARALTAYDPDSSWKAVH